MPDGSVTWNFKNTPSTRPTALWNRTATDGYNYTYANGVTVNTTKCSITFDVPEVMEAPVLVYYRLTNFYQNHRRYVKSFQSDQLKGVAVDNGTISNSMCDPLKLDEHGKAYYPCGLIANSIFNDTFYNPFLTNAPNSTVAKEYVMSNNSGIAWESDKALQIGSRDSLAVTVMLPHLQTYPKTRRSKYGCELQVFQSLASWL